MRNLAPHGVIMLRDPFSRLLSAYKYQGGNMEPWPKGTNIGNMSRVRDWWAHNFTRYLTFPGVLGCQTKMLMGRACNTPA